jgi:acyl carrier protein
VIEVFGQIVPEADLDTLDPAQTFRDQFEFDSVDYLNFVMTLEKRLAIKIPEIECPRLASLNGCTAYLEGKFESQT